MSWRLPDTQSMSVPEAAAAWRGAGWKVVPIREDKRPLVKWKNAPLAPPAQTAVLFRGFGARSRNIGLAVALPEDLLVLDIDHRPDRGWLADDILEALNARFQLPEAPTAMTPSGGRHIWLALPDGVRLSNGVSGTSRLPVEGVDHRTGGGLLIVPPTIRDGQMYRWLPSVAKLANPANFAKPEAVSSPFSQFSQEISLAPQSLIDALRPPLRRPVCPKPYLKGRPGRYAETVLARELDAVATCSAGGRNSRLFLATVRLAEFHAGGELPDVRATLEDAAARCGLARDDGWPAVRATIRSGWQRGLSTPRRAPQRGG